MNTLHGTELPNGIRYKKLIRRELVVSPIVYGDMFPKNFNVFEETPKRIFAPRYWAAEHFGRAKDVFGRIDRMNSSVEFTGTLRTDIPQQKAFENTVTALKTTGGGVLSLDVGYGKTVVSIAVAAKMKLKTMIIVHKHFLMDQFVGSIKKFAPAAKVTIVQGDRYDISGDFVVCMLQTMLSRKYDMTDAGFGMLIVDECHRICAEYFSRVMFMVSFKYTLGLSATPIRADGLARVLHWFLGPICYELKRTNQKNVSVHVIPYDHSSYDDPPLINKRGDIDHPGMISRICGLYDRTRFIAERVKVIANSGRYVLVLTHRREHAKDLAKELADLGVDSGTYLGGDKISPDVQVICATYMLVSEGYDNARLSALVLATPSSSVHQICGRVMRGGANDPIIVDILDQYSIFRGQFYKRKSFYKKVGFSFANEADKSDEDITLDDALFVDDDN